MIKETIIINGEEWGKITERKDLWKDEETIEKILYNAKGEIEERKFFRKVKPKSVKE